MTVNVIRNYVNKYDFAVDSVDALVNSRRLSSLGEVYIQSYYDGWQATTAGPKGGHLVHTTGGTASSPSVPPAVSVGTIGSGAQAGYYWDQDGVEWQRTQTQYIDALSVGFSESNSAAENYNIAQDWCRNDGETRRTIKFPNGTYQFDVFNPNNCVIVGDDAVFQFTYNAAKSQVMGQFTNCEIRGCTFQSLETDLQNQRTQIGNCLISDCKFIGWRNPTNSDAWGVYISGDQGETKLFRCGFNDNTQADIAIVDGAQNVLIEQCYGIDNVGDPFHINFEPNGSTFNNNAKITACNIGLLSLLENGSGGTSNRGITVENCQIDNLIYDGATAEFINCKIENITRESSPFGGICKFINSIGLGENIIPDPYLMSNAFNQAQAVANGQAWYMRARTGTITNGGRLLGQSGGIRYFSLNGASQNGLISYSLKTDLVVDTSKVYAVIITGRGLNNSGADVLSLEDGATSITCRLFRQANQNVFEFSTEVVFIKPTNTDLNTLIQNTGAGGTAGVDIKSISVHEVDFNGRNFNEMVASIHNSVGSREIFVSTLPAANPLDQTGFQVGDNVIDAATSKTYAWSGAGFVAVF